MSVASPQRNSGSEQRVRLHGITWETYLSLRESPENFHLRMSYDRGTLEIMSPSNLHELYSKLLDRFVQEVTTESGQQLVSLGSTTWRLASDEKGLESDNCYYIVDVSRVSPRDEIDLAVDPPPDLAIEVDLSNSSLPKLPIYKSLRIPEVWRFDGDDLTFLQLAEDGYVEREHSVHIPWLASDTLFQLLDDYAGRDLNAWGLSIRGWMNETVLPRLKNPNH